MPLPSGTITFLFTDIEGSTKLWEEHPEAMRVALARHDALLRHTIEANNGVVFKTIGDAFCAAFHTAPSALAAALAAQLALHQEVWPDALVLRVRMALHTGAAELREGDYFGPPLNRVARLLAASHGEQTLLSDVAHDLARDSFPSAASLLPLGEHRLRDLGRPEPVFQLLHPDLPADFAPLKSLNNPDLPNNLPQQMTSFIGREKEMEAVKTLLAKTRLLTITGSGGSGKTRLALQVAADVLDHYPDGAWLIELAPLADPALVPQTLAQTLSVSEEAGKPLVQTLTSALRDKKMLIVLDNCEHVLEACARLADTLLRHCHGVRILASSREGLGIAGEQTYRLPSLSLPDVSQPQTTESVTQYEAVRLFIERAMAVQPQFAVTNQNAPALAQLCLHLDGIPFAIELAAARVRSLSVEEINTRLDNRFRLLTGGSRTALPRQQTLRALIDWSYDLLNAQEKTLLRRLSVFAGGWTLAAAEQVGTGEDTDTGESIEEWEILDLLSSLADKSLVLAETQGEITRYRLLETVRQYAIDRLVESAETLLMRVRHGAYFLTLIEAIRPKLTGAEQTQWLRVLEEEHDNLRQALFFYTEEDKDAQAGEKGLRLAADLQLFWQIRGYLSEGRERLSTLLAHPSRQEPTKARSDALNGAGGLAFMQNDYAQGTAFFEECLAIRRELGDKNGVAGVLNNLAILARNQGDYVRARVLHEECLTLARELGDKRIIAQSLSGLGILYSHLGEYDKARLLYEESLTLARAMGDLGGVANVLNNLGSVAYDQGDYVRARVLHEECLILTHELGDKWGIAYSLEAFAALAVAERQHKRGVQLWSGATALRENIEAPLSPAAHEEQEREMLAVRQTLSETAFAQAWEQGRLMTMEQSIALALENGTE